MTIRFVSLSPALDGFDVEATAERRSVTLDPTLESAFVAHEQNQVNVTRLMSNDALCITTGQQPGLLTGPLYTVYKALSAIALSRSLEARLDRPVVPVFWVAGDDHDFAEANHVFTVAAGNEVRRHTLRERGEEDPLTALYREPVGDGFEQLLTEFMHDTPASEFRPAILEWIRRHYQPTADLASAFGDAMAELMDRFGLVVFQPTRRPAKRMMAPLLIRALELAGDLNDVLATRIENLKRRERPVPVPVDSHATLVLLDAALGRDRLMRDGNGFRTRRSDERFSIDELREIADRDPERLSPNVLLRPVIEAALLPTIAYVGGPSEVAYLEECDPIYEALGITPQARVPRWSGLAIENHIEKVLKKFDIAPTDLGAPEGQLESRLVRDEMPAAATDALAALRENLNREYDRLAKASATVDPTLTKHVSQSGRSALREVADIEKRLIAHLRKQNEIANNQIAKARAHLFPLGKPQERILNVVPFLTRHGPTFLDTALATCASWSAPLETASSKA